MKAPWLTLQRSLAILGLGVLIGSAPVQAQVFSGAFPSEVIEPLVPPNMPAGSVVVTAPSAPAVPSVVPSSDIDLPPVMPSPLAFAAGVIVDANDVVRTVDDLMIGVNTAVWDEALTYPRTLELLKAADVRTLRFPGGSTSNTYDWETGRSYKKGTRTLEDWDWVNHFDDFAPIALALKAKVYISVNYGSGTPEQAAAWVKYSNVTKGYGFKYWEIGNENYGDWEEDLRPLKHHPETYAEQAKEFIAQMKAEDPTIKIGVVVLANAMEEEGWTPRVLAKLKELGVQPDFAVYHRYPYGPGLESDAALLGGESVGHRTWAEDAAAIRAMITQHYGAGGEAIELHMTENNSVWTEPGKQSTSLVNGLFYADSFGQILQTEFKSFVWWALHNGQPRDSQGNKLGNFSASLYGWRNYGDYGILSSNDSQLGLTANDPHPTYYVIKMLQHFARAGDQIVRATSDDPLVAVYASKRANGQLALLLINKSQIESADVDVTLEGYTPFPSAPVFTYGVPQDEAARTNRGHRDVTAAALTGAAAEFSVTLPRYSVNVITLYPQGEASRLAALSVRAVAGGASQSLINGFVIGGSGTSGTLPLLVRCVGPSLANYGLPTGFLSDPKLTLHDMNDAGKKLDENDDWGGAAGLAEVFQRVGASALSSATSRDAAFYYPTMANGVYTAVVDAKGGSGVSLAEVYDGSTDPDASTPRLTAISGRGQVNTGDNVLIGGFVIAGSRPKTVLIRGLGPALTVENALAAPQLTLHRSGEGVIASNTAWGGSSDLSSVFKRLGMSPDLESTPTSNDTALLVTLTPGIYTAVVSGVNSTTGVALMEIYEVP